MDIKKLIAELIAVATGEIDHTGDGLCPDRIESFDSRDPDCPACKILTEAEARVAELETDAARYRYIRTHRIGVKWCELYACGPGLDAAIDAMMNHQKGHES